jgi:hypothetical protein
LTRLEINCVSSKPEKLPDAAAVNDRTYKGFLDKAGAGDANMEEFINVWEMRDTTAAKINVGLGYNDTTVISSGIGANGPPPHMLRLNR